MLIDTHCHLYSKEFDADRPAMLQRALEAGVERFYLPAIDRETTAKMLQLEQDFPGQCLAMMGIHPCSVNAGYQTELAHAEEWLSRRAFAGIGETGLDFYWDKTFLAQQYDAFRVQVDWAKRYGLPIIIHSRNATPECIAVIRESLDERLTGIFHCFGGSLEEAQQITAMGFYLGIGGVLTYKNSGLAAVLEQLPLTHIVLETDAPYLSPVPHRGKRNESAYLSHVVQKLADVKKMRVEEVAEITTANANAVFKYNGKG